MFTNLQYKNWFNIWLNFILNLKIDIILISYIILYTYINNLLSNNFYITKGNFLYLNLKTIEIYITLKKKKERKILVKYLIIQIFFENLLTSQFLFKYIIHKIFY